MHFALFFSNPKTLFRLRRRSRIACAPSQDDPIFRTFFASSFDSVPKRSSGTTFHTFFRFLSENGPRKWTQGVSHECGFRTLGVSGCRPQVHLGAPGLPWGPLGGAPPQTSSIFDDFWIDVGSIFDDFLIDFDMIFLSFSTFFLGFSDDFTWIVR